jgi:hypothetical protein
MKRRTALASTTLCAIALVGATAVPASADRPARFLEDVAGGQVVCGETILTATEGTGVGREHIHQLPSGLYRLILRETLRGIRLTDGTTTYRAVGTIGGNFVTSDIDSDEAIVAGFFHIKVNIIGPGGLLGSVDFTERLTPSGSFSEQNRGSCDFVE